MELVVAVVGAAGLFAVAYALSRFVARGSQRWSLTVAVISCLTYAAVYLLRTH